MKLWLRQVATYVDIKNLADLAKIAALCRKKGIETLKIGPNGIEFTLGAEPGKTPRKQWRPMGGAKEEEPKAYTEEDILFYSSAGVHEGAN